MLTEICVIKLLRITQQDDVTQILMKPDYVDRFSKNTKISNFTKIRPMGTELLHADRRTDMTKLMVAFRNFTNASKKSMCEWYQLNKQHFPSAMPWHQNSV